MQAGVKVLCVFLFQSFIKNICASAHELRQLKVCATANRQGLSFVAGKAPYSGACWLGKLSVSGFWWVAAKIISGFCKVCAAAKCYRATAHRFHRQPRRCAKPLKKTSLAGQLFTAAGKHNKRIVWDAFGAPHAGVSRIGANLTALLSSSPSRSNIFGSTELANNHCRFYLE